MLDFIKRWSLLREFVNKDPLHLTCSSNSRERKMRLESLVQDFARP